MPDLHINKNGVIMEESIVDETVIENSLLQDVAMKYFDRESGEPQIDKKM